MTTFEKALQFVFQNEGGFSDHPADRGGATSQYGVTQEELAKWRGWPVSKQDVKNMPQQEAKDIYWRWYFAPLGCDRMVAPGIATCVFDLGVVRGIGIPGRYVQEILNMYGAKLEVDGKVGLKTTAVLNATDPKVFIPDYVRRTRRGFLGIVASRPTQIVFLKGWLNRANRYLTLLEK